MFKILTIMAIGVILGRMLKSKNLEFVNKLVSVLIWLLLLLLGISVGANDKVMSSLDTIGISALILSSLATLGSCVAAWALYKFVFKAKGKL
ncbi:MAG: LysO family transporter [Rikenellaceae bacterium]